MQEYLGVAREEGVSDEEIGELKINKNNKLSFVNGKRLMLFKKCFDYQHYLGKSMKLTTAAKMSGQNTSTQKEWLLESQLSSTRCGMTDVRGSSEIMPRHQG